jgi:hypothetical protein
MPAVVQQKRKRADAKSARLSISLEFVCYFAAAVSKLSITQVPRIGTAGQPSGAIALQATDAFGNLVLPDTSALTITDPNGRPISGSTTVHISINTALITIAPAAPANHLHRPLRNAQHKPHRLGL